MLSSKKSEPRNFGLLFFLRTITPLARRCSARLIGFAECSGFRLAPLALRWAGSLAAPLASHHHAFGALVFRPADWLRQTLGLQARSALPSVSGGLAAPLASHHHAFGALVFRPADWLRQTLGLQAHSACPSVSGGPSGPPAPPAPAPALRVGQTGRSALLFLRPGKELRRDVGIGQVFRQRVKQANLFDLKGRQRAELLDFGGKSAAAAAFQPHPVVKQRR